MIEYCETSRSEFRRPKNDVIPIPQKDWNVAFVEASGNFPSVSSRDIVMFLKMEPFMMQVPARKMAPGAWHEAWQHNKATAQYLMSLHCLPEELQKGENKMALDILPKS